MKAQK